MRPTAIRASIGLCLLLAVGPRALAAEPMVWATEGEYPPWNDLGPGGAFIGFEPELIAILCERLETDCEIVKTAWPELLDVVAAGAVDAGVSGIAVTAERAEKVLFTRPYASLSMSFAVSAAGPLAQVQPASRDEQLQRLSSATVGFQTGTVNAILVAEHLPNAVPVSFLTTPELVAAVATGAIDAGLASTQSWGDPGVSLFGEPLTGADSALLAAGVAIALPPGADAIKAELDTAICALSADGTLTALTTRWFGHDLAVRCEN